MTDVSRYKNASISIKTMELIKKQAKEICPVELSISKTIEHNSRFYEKYKHLVKPDETLITSRFKSEEHKSPTGEGTWTAVLNDNDEPVMPPRWRKVKENNNANRS